MITQNVEDTQYDGQDQETIYVTRRKKCDKNLGPGWFRFQGKAGTKLPTKCLSMSRCGTYETGWLRGTHPSVASDIVVVVNTPLLFE